MRNSKNIAHFVLGTVRQLMLIANIQNICDLISREEYNIRRIALAASILYFLTKKLATFDLCGAKYIN